MADFLVTTRNTPSRNAARVSYDRAAAYAVLDEAPLCHLAFLANGEPQALPTLHVRVADTLYLHASTGGGPALALRQPGARISVAVTVLDGLVFGRSQFHHSANYRSVVVHGEPRLVTDEAEKLAAMMALVDKAGTVAAGSAQRPGRAGDSREPSAKELAQTAVLAVPLVEVSLKQRAAGVLDDPADLALPHWAGVVPLTLAAGLAEPDTGVAVPVPAYLRPARSPWLEPAVLVGEHVRLEPLDVCHATELFRALDDDEVWRYLPSARPDSPEAMTADITAKLRDAARGLRTAWVQRDATSGAVIGTTSYCPPDPKNRSVHIGSTQLARSTWRTGVNTEAKLLLMTHAFETLGAGRVELQTDCLNTRSQAAIERLGATREGILRRHKQRADGSWRDSYFYGITVDEWPEVRNRLVTRLARG